MPSFYVGKWFGRVCVCFLRNAGAGWSLLVFHSSFDASGLLGFLYLSACASGLLFLWQQLKIYLRRVRKRSRAFVLLWTNLGRARMQIYKDLGRDSAKHPNGLEPTVPTEAASTQRRQLRGKRNTRTHYVASPPVVPSGPARRWAGR